ncbi:DDE-type integrase/transposase/recombinase [Ornithinimicrobium cavernae]|uniref:DDE-type integrase/transposase/recombinase n=1 Tax=Ornithinimicrobium cavernae TaxID=2666047 RepID=UPI000D690A9F|nr:DDE-type integrase/transposase/recombinase [Ornithinimicrobium cavernae]
MAEGFGVELSNGDRVMTDRGPAVVTRLGRHDVDLSDSLGSVRSVPFTQLTARSLTAEGVQAEHSSLVPWWHQLPDEARKLALFKQECVLEARTGFRHGLPELAQPGEPFFPFGDGYGVSLTRRYENMAEVISFERTADRDVMRRVYDGELQDGRIGARTLQSWDQAWAKDGLRGLVDGRSTRGRQDFEPLDSRFRQIAHEEFAAFDGTTSTVNLQEIERRIRVRMKYEGIDDAHLPQRLTAQFLSHHYRALGRTTRAQKSRSLRKVSSRSNYPAHHPGHCASDLTRADNLVYDPLLERPMSVEIGTIMSVSTRVITALRIFPRSANGVDIGLLLYDALRSHSMLVDDHANIDDWRWTGIPTSLDLSGNPIHTGRRPVAKSDQSLRGVHQIPGLTPHSLRSDHGSIFVGAHFRNLLAQFGITLMLSRGKKPTDNPHVERLHETYQRFYQQQPGFKGRAVHERGSYVGVVADEPLCTAQELGTRLRQFIALDYHRQPHSGLTLPGAPGIRLTPLEMFDAIAEATGRLLVPQHPDLIYQFLPIRWLRVGHAGVEYKDLTYDADVLEDLRDVRPGQFRDKDNAVPFHYDPRDVTRLWFRHPDTDRIHEVRWRGSHLIHAPLVDVVRDRALARIRERGGNRALNRTTVMRQIIDEIGELTTTPSSEEWRSKMAAARLRWEQAQKDHNEVAEAHRLLEQHASQGLPRIPRVDQPPQAEGVVEAVLDFEEPWPDYEEFG